MVLPDIIGVYISDLMDITEKNRTEFHWLRQIWKSRTSTMTSVRPNKKICVFTVTRPTLFFSR